MIYLLLNNLLPLDQRYDDMVNDLVDENCISDPKSFLNTYCTNGTDTDDGGNGGRRLVEMFEFIVNNNTDSCHDLMNKACDMYDGETGLGFAVAVLGLAGLIGFCCIWVAPKCCKPETQQYSDDANCCSGVRNHYLLSENSNATLKFFDINLSNTSLNTAKAELPRRMMFKLLEQPWGGRGPRLPIQVVDVIYEYAGREESIKNGDGNSDDDQVGQQLVLN